uniref:Uncharacterized protein n=1 Tax=Arundo donax TaxID=35708 RepID=A0A0A8YJF3_ARUDO
MFLRKLLSLVDCLLMVYHRVMSGLRKFSSA